MHVLSDCANVFVLAQQQLLEGVLEGGIAQGIAGGVNRAVDVTKPVAQHPHGVRDAARAESVDQHHDIVRGPCDHKGQKNSHDSPCNLPLSVAPILPLFLVRRHEDQSHQTLSLLVMAVVLILTVTYGLLRWNSQKSKFGTTCFYLRQSLCLSALNVTIRNGVLSRTG